MPSFPALAATPFALLLLNTKITTPRTSATAAIPPTTPPIIGPLLLLFFPVPPPLVAVALALDFPVLEEEFVAAADDVGVVWKCVTTVGVKELPVAAASGEEG